MHLKSMMLSDNSKIRSLNRDEQLLFLNAFDITLDDYLKHYGENILNICLGEDDFKRKQRLYESYLKMRKDGYSVAAIIKKKDFYTSTFYVDENVLIPRPETETLVEKALDEVKRINNSKLHDKNNEQVKILDMCTGSGCIGISILKEAIKMGINISLTLSDISKDALNVSKINYKNIIADRGKNEPLFIEGDLFQNIPKHKKFDIIVSNPPYIKDSDEDSLEIEVKREPRIALFGGNDGLDIIKRLINESVNHLNNNGVLAFEFGLGEEGDIDILLRKSFEKVSIVNDLTERPRFAFGWRSVVK